MDKIAKKMARGSIPKADVLQLNVRPATPPRNAFRSTHQRVSLVQSFVYFTLSIPEMLMTIKMPRPKHQRLIPAANTPSTRSLVYMPFLALKPKSTRPRKTKLPAQVNDRFRPN